MSIASPFNNVFRGIGTVQNSPTEIQSPYYLSPEQGLKVYDYNPQRAKELLLEAGFKYNSRGQLLDTDGNPVRFSLITNTEKLIEQEVADWEAEIGRLYIQGAQELDEAKRKAIYAETQRLAQEYLPFIYLVNPLSLAAVRDRVQGVKYSALGSLGATLWKKYELKVAE